MAHTLKTVLITGCSAGGIGDALAQEFRGRGYYVFAAVRNPAKISPELSGAHNVRVLTLDVLSSTSIDAAVRSVRDSTGGRLDILVNNSGGGYLTPALDASIDEGKKLFDLNVWAPLAMLQAFAPLLIEAKGIIINNSSASAYVPMSLMSIYNASKAALAMCSETWRQELQPLGVRTITLITCAVKTEFFDNNQPTELPSTSYYVGIRDFVRSIGDGRLQAKAMSPQQYAANVVRKVERGTRGTVWAGTDATMNRLGLWLSPQYVMDMIIESIVPLAGEMAKATRKKNV